MTIALEELVLEFHPVQSQRVQEALHDVHGHEDAECHTGEDQVCDCYLCVKVNLPQ